MTRRRHLPGDGLRRLPREDHLHGISFRRLESHQRLWQGVQEDSRGPGPKAPFPWGTGRDRDSTT